MTAIDMTLKHAPLGKVCSYAVEYDPKLLFPIPRDETRQAIGIHSNALPFTGDDTWTAFEISWLNPKGKPQIAIGDITFPCIAANIIESKSLKLYLHSFNQSRFASMQELQAIIQKDLTQCAGGAVTVELSTMEDLHNRGLQEFSGECLDDLDITTDVYEPPCPQFLQVGKNEVEERLFSHLLKSNCLVTGQPDWASVYIYYKGKQIDRAGLLKYIISFRNQNEFHEQCCERMFVDILNRCAPESLAVSLRYTRRGGLDINPFRSNCSERFATFRLARQ